MLALTLLASAFADFSALATRPVDYRVFGTICEQVAKLRLEAEYPPPAFVVETGLEYKLGHTTLGELDVVVLRADGAAVLVGEVKCRPNVQHAVRLAHDQLDRFRGVVEDQAPVRITAKGAAHRVFPVARFAGCTRWVSISQSGGVAAGFDRDIGLSLEDATALRDELMACQLRGECATAP